MKESNYNLSHPNYTIRKQKVKIIQTSFVPKLGLIADIQHHLDGIAPKTLLHCQESGCYWWVDKRVFHGELIARNQEVFFPNETIYTHIQTHFTSPEQLENCLSDSKKKRQQGIYAYLIHSPQKHLVPPKGSDLWLAAAG